MKFRTGRGFTLIEIMIAVVIIGVLTTLAVPTFLSIKQRTLHFRFMNDIRIFKDACETYYMEVGSLPVDSAAGTLDAGMAEYIYADKFAERTPIGGRWDIESDDSGITLGVGVVGYTVDSDELTTLDGRFDDGLLGSGVLRDLGSGSGYFYVLE